LNKILKFSLGAVVLGIAFFIILEYTPARNAFISLKMDETVAKGSAESKDIPKEVAVPKDLPEVEVASIEQVAKVETAAEVKLMSEDLTESKPIILPNEIILDVPLLNQMDAPRLYNGCEVTSLAMVLNFNGMKVTKNQLATKITRVPLEYQDGTNGNPNVGFVGNMEDGPGLGVYHEPIYSLAKSYMGSRVQDLTKQPFSAVIEKVGQGLPVWVITTTSFAPTSEINTWSTRQGPVDITYKMHSVVITGYDAESIYINDPYGTKNKKVNRENFMKAWEQMGSQAVVVNK
jgi:uncharacterized protein YvpB